MRRVLLLISLVLFGLNQAYAEIPSPLGYWKTIDDVTNKPRSIIQIGETPNHTLVGKIVKIYPKPGADQHELCAACEGEQHNQPIVGMNIMTGLKLAQEQWGDGKILDPSNGKTYRCVVKPYQDGKKLLVRGYIGMPLLGRSQTWVRADQHELA